MTQARNLGSDPYGNLPSWERPSGRAMAAEADRKLRELRKQREIEARRAELAKLEKNCDLLGLLRALRADTESTVRGAAAYHLGRLHDARAVDALIAALEDDPCVGIKATYALGEIRDARAIAPLLAMADRPDVDGGVLEAIARTVADLLRSRPECCMDAPPQVTEPVLIRLEQVQVEIAAILHRLNTEFSNDEYLAALDTPGAAAVEGFKKERAATQASLRVLLCEEASLVAGLRAATG